MTRGVAAVGPPLVRGPTGFRGQDLGPLSGRDARWEAGPERKDRRRDRAVWCTRDRRYIAFVAKSYIYAGTVNVTPLVQMADRSPLPAQEVGRRPGQLGGRDFQYGGKPETFTFSGFHVLSGRR